MRNMNNRGQEGFFIALIVFSFVILIFLGGVSFLKISGNTINNVESNLIILNGNDCLNQKDQFGFKVDCDLSIKNLGSTSVEITPEFKCWKISNPSDFEIIKVGKDAIPSGSIKTFEFSYDNDGREWSCQIYNYNTRK